MRFLLIWGDGILTIKPGVFDRVNYIDSNGNSIEADPNRTYSAIMYPVMQNITYCIDFNIDRHKIDMLIKSDIPEDYISIYNPIVGYTGVNVKRRVHHPPDLQLYGVFSESNENGVSRCERLRVNYDCYLEHLDDHDRKMQIKKDKLKFASFLIFRSGQIIMICAYTCMLKQQFDMFNDFLAKYKDEIEEDEIPILP